MRSVRLFVGGISPDVDECMLNSKLSNYGSVSNAEIKEKLDFEGKVMQRFAYVNINGSQEDLEECVGTLNGCNWQGSRLRVEVAKESFLDRLKREREGAQNKSYGGPANFRSPLNQNRQETQAKEREFKVFANEKRKHKNEFLESDSLDAKASKFGPKKVKNEAEEEMMASFKTFSSFWADSDEDEDKGVVLKMSNKEKRRLEEERAKRLESMAEDEEMKEDSSSSEEESSDEEPERRLATVMKQKKWGVPKKATSNDKEDSGRASAITRYVPTVKKREQTFKLNFSDDKKEDPEEPLNEINAIQSSVFSLLSMFNENRPEVKEDEDEPEETEKEYVPVLPELPLEKSQSFFLSSEDERIKDGMNWMKEMTSERLKPEFTAVENDLYDVIKTRSLRAMTDLRKKYMEGKGKGFNKKNSVQDAVLPVIEEQSHDRGWRLAEIFQEELKRRAAVKTANQQKAAEQNAVRDEEGDDKGSDGEEGKDKPNQPHRGRGGRGDRGRGNRGRGGRGRGGRGRGSRGHGNRGRGGNYGQDGEWRSRGGSGRPMHRNHDIRVRGGRGRGFGQSSNGCEVSVEG